MAEAQRQQQPQQVRNQDPQLDSEEVRMEKLKNAALEIYQKGIGVKEAARRHKVTYADLKYFYENEAQDFLPLGDEDDDGDDY